MKKFSCMMMGAAALAAFTACSSDDVKPVNPDQGNGDGTTMYLSINIKDANSRSRDIKTEDDAPFNEGDLVWGNVKEHKVNRADFFFFDGDGNYVANTYEAYTGEEFEPGKDENVEWMGKNRLVLRDLDENNLPEYMITVLNAPASLCQTIKDGALSIDETRKLTQAITENDYFIMSTTSFYGGDTNRYNDTYYYATKLQPGDFTKEVTNQNDVETVDVYVERLAAKFELINLDKDNAYEVTVTIAGEDNENGGENLRVLMKGFGISGMEKTSNLSKNLDGYLNNDPYTDWNDATHFRSFWGKSYNYKKTLEEANLSYTDYAAAEKSGLGIHYGYETTAALNVLTNTDKVLNPKRTPNYIIVAEVQAWNEETSTWGGLDLIEYRGTYYTYEQFQRVALARAKANGVEFFTRVQSGTVPDTSEGAPEGATKPVYDYTGLSFDDYTFDFEAANQGTGTVNAIITAINEEKTGLWQKVNDEWVAVAKPIETMNTALRAITNENANGHKAYAFEGGAMFYNVPIEHSQSLDKLTPAKVEGEGVYGVVRNHWYQLSIGKVMGLGHGVFNPGSEENPGEPIIPDTPDNDRYALGANINILSWKIVQQSVDL